MFGEKRTLDSGWLERAQNDITDRNKSAYQSALNQAKSNYANADWLTKLTSGVTESNYLKRHGFNDELQQAASTGQLSGSDLYDYLGGVERNLTADMEKGTGAVSALNNIPVVGGILNYLTAPVAQLAGAGRALQAGTQGDWNRWNQRDHVSDAAALGKVALEALTAGFGAPEALGAKLKFGMATGAADNALDTIREQGSNVNAGDLLRSAGVGAAFGGAIPLAGAGLKKAGSNLAARGANVLNNAGVDPASVAKSTQVGLGLRNLGASGVNRFRNLTTPQKALMLGGAGAGTIGIANLLNRNNQQPQLSEEDLAALYNYYGVGE